MSAGVSVGLITLIAVVSVVLGRLEYKHHRRYGVGVDWAYVKKLRQCPSSEKCGASV